MNDCKVSVCWASFFWSLGITDNMGDRLQNTSQAWLVKACFKAFSGCSSAKFAIQQRRFSTMWPVHKNGQPLLKTFTTAKLDTANEMPRWCKFRWFCQCSDRMVVKLCHRPDNNRNAYILMKRPLPNLGKQALFLSNHNLTYARLPALGISWIQVSEVSRASSAALTAGWIPVECFPAFGTCVMFSRA